MKISTKAVLVVASVLSLVNLAQAQSGISDRLERVNRARRGLNQSAGGAKKISTKKVSTPQTNSTGNPNTSRSIPHIDLAVISVKQQNNGLRVRVMNVGRTIAPQSRLKIYVRDFNNGQVKMERWLTVKQLSPNQAVNMVMRTSTLNNVNVYATADGDNKVIEPNERNNVGTLVIGNQTEYTIDLKIQEIRFDRTKKEVWVGVRNIGPVALNGAASVRLRSYFGPGNQLENQYRRVRSINTGQQTFVRFSVQQMKVGMQFEAIVDPSNALPEQSEQNNKMTRTFNG